MTRFEDVLTESDAHSDATRQCNEHAYADISCEDEALVANLSSF